MQEEEQRLRKVHDNIMEDLRCVLRFRDTNRGVTKLCRGGDCVSGEELCMGASRYDVHKFFDFLTPSPLVHI